MKNKINLVLGLINIFWYFFVIIFYYFHTDFFNSSVELIIFSSFLNFGVGLFNIVGWWFKQ